MFHSLLFYDVDNLAFDDDNLLRSVALQPALSLLLGNDIAFDIGSLHRAATVGDAYKLCRKVRLLHIIGETVDVYIIKRGVEVEVPQEVFEVLQNQQKMRDHIDAYNEKHEAK